MDRGNISVSKSRGHSSTRLCSIIFTFSLLACMVFGIFFSPGDASADTYQLERMWPQPYSFLDGPVGIAVDSQGNVYVSDYGNPNFGTIESRVQIFDPSGNLIFRLGSQGLGGSGDGEFQTPMGVALDSSGNIYVVDNGNHRIQKFGPSGNFITKWGEPGSDDGQFIGPSFVAVDTSGNVYVTDSSNSRVQKFGPSGTFIRKWGSPGTGNGEFQNPQGIAVDSAGNVYVADWFRIQKFDSDGNYLTQWGSMENMIFSGLVADNSGHLFAVDNNNGWIRKYDSNGTLLAEWGSMGMDDGEFQLPQGIALDSAGNIYVADTVNNRVQKLDSGGSYLSQLGTTGTGPGKFYGSAGLSVDSSGSFFVADAGNRRIQKFDAGGNFVLQWGSLGTGDGQFSHPVGIAVDSLGNVFVSDHQSNRIQKFDSSGAFIRKWGSWGTGDGEFKDLRAIAVDSSGNVYAADYFNYRIQKFDADGNFLGKWGSRGTGDGEFSAPNGIAVDSSGNVYVADFQRIQKFDSNGSFIAKWGQFQNVAGVAVDDLGNVFVAGDMNCRIQKFDSSGRYVTEWNACDTDNLQLSYPSQITVDSSGNVYVSDGGLNRIQKFILMNTMPDQFTFSDQTNVPLSSLRTSNITVSGTGAPQTISITNCTSSLCEYSINVGGWTSSEGTVHNGDSVVVRQTSSPTNSGTTDLTLDIGGVSDTFSVSTYAEGMLTVVGTVEGGNGTIVCAPYAVNLGETATCSISAPPGWHLSALTDNDLDVISSVSAGEYILLNVTVDHVVKAWFAQNQYAVTGTVESTVGSGTITCLPSTVLHGGGSTCTISASTGWYLSALTDNGTDVMAQFNAGQFGISNITAEHVVRAWFSQYTYPVAGTVEGGSGTIDCTPPNVAYGGSATCTVGASTGWYLSALTDNGADVMSQFNAGQYGISNITAEHTVRAWFSQYTYPVTGTVETGTGTIDCTPPNVAHGENATCTVSASTGWYLSAITDNDMDVMAQVNAGQFGISNITAEHAIHAFFAEYPVKRMSGQNAFYYSGIQAALEDASTLEGDVISILTGELTDSVDFTKPLSLKISGGFASGFSGRTGQSVMRGDLTITNGTIEFDEFAIAY